MRLSSEEGSVVEFASTLESEEAREPVALLDCRQPRNDQFLRICSWCQRVKLGSIWLPIEVVVVELSLMTAPTVPAITHGICEDCYDRVMSENPRLVSSF
jgi:hypothetical protein